MRTRNLTIALIAVIMFSTMLPMDAESGRVDALALPGVHYRVEMTEDDQAKIQDIQRIRDFIEKNAPGSQVIIVPPGSPKAEIANESGFEKLPFTYGGDLIFIRRKPVYDRGIRVSA